MIQEYVQFHVLAEACAVANTIKINVYADPSRPEPTLSLPDVPWYAGISALQAMVIGEALHPKNFSFRVTYKSIYGAFVDGVNDLADNKDASQYWMLYIDGEEAQVGASESILLGRRRQATLNPLGNWARLNIYFWLFLTIGRCPLSMMPLVAS
jgi:hypothetical protein